MSLMTLRFTTGTLERARVACTFLPTVIQAVLIPHSPAVLPLCRGRSGQDRGAHQFQTAHQLTLSFSLKNTKTRAPGTARRYTGPIKRY